MSDCHDMFQKFHDAISLEATRIETFQRLRDAVRDRIRNYYSSELGLEAPIFCPQGSLALKTAIYPLPLNKRGIDDGVCLLHLGNDRQAWPTTETVRKQIYDAVTGHTEEDPQDKENCVRVVYSILQAYHIDLPIYSFSNKVVYLARKGAEQWVRSNPAAFTDWFFRVLKSSGEQMRRNVKYLKAWNDLNKTDLRGIMMTILVGEHHVDTQDRDDISFTATVDAAISYLKAHGAIYNPVDKSENLLADWSTAQVFSVIEALEKLSSSAHAALDTRFKKDASEIWNSVFGIRFLIANGQLP